MYSRVHPISICVEHNATLFSFDYVDVLQIFTTTPEVSVKVMAYVSSGTYQLMDTVNILTQLNANKRQVMRQAEIYRLLLKQDRRVLFPVTKKLLSTQKGITPETLFRTIENYK
ncbi:hypothetical protein [Photobacterium sanguinicancri]|uniref:hypothetical protein n=1 Tax=Photobacterium sanguinicancri TaxID=875932 RepID=UPI00247FF69F|nr:hypothetical protein [Photobacterium sanguinicancri]